MKIIISPAKSFKKVGGFETSNLLFEKETKELVKFMKEKSLSEIGNMFRTNDNLTEKAYFDYKDFDFKKLNSPAIFAYNGLVYKQFNQDSFSDYEYLDEHVYIISPLYGLLKPFTGIRDYRMYMDIKEKDMYSFWSDKLYKKAYENNDLLINLASKEYSSMIRNFLKNDDKFISINFLDEKDGKLKSIVAWMKQMRGKMLNYLIENKIESIEEIKKIEIDDYKFDPLTSTSNELNFVRRYK